MKINYQKELDKILEGIEGKVASEKGESGSPIPTLLLHSCCGPCSSYVLEYLCKYFKVTVYYCNPCISPRAEYEKRKAEQIRLIGEMNKSGELAPGHEIDFLEDEYDHEKYLRVVDGHEADPEGGERCHLCYRERLELAAAVAAAGHYDYFTTTLSVSPYKNAEVLNEIGLEIAARTGLTYLVSDFKKREGYKRSIELSKVYNLYRQDYCGCEFSIRGEENG